MTEKEKLQCSAMLDYLADNFGGQKRLIVEVILILSKEVRSTKTLAEHLLKTVIASGYAKKDGVLIEFVE